MVETTGRYCSNCGQELGVAGQFCPNCGSPVHRTAHVPTPEADVPVLPPPQPGSGISTSFGPTTQGQPAQSGAARRHPILTGCLGVVVLFFLLAIIGAALGSGDETAGGEGGAANNDAQPSAEDANNEAKEPEAQEEKPEAEKKPKPEPEPEPEQESAKPSFGDGTYQVGTDIQPGTYRTREGSPNCYYERLKDFTGGLNSIIANGNTNNPTIVTIAPSDAGFQSQNCGTWKKLE